MGERKRFFNMTPDNILNAVASATGVSPVDIKSRSRVKIAALARQIAMYYTYKTGNTFVEVGEMFDRNHASIMHAVKCVTQWRDCDWEVRDILDKVDELIPGLARTHEIKYKAA